MKDFLPKLLSRRPFVLIPFLSLILLVLAFDLYIRMWVQNNNVSSYPLGQISYSSYPLSKDSSTPNISAESAIVMDNDSKVVLFAKNPEFRFSTASTAKIMSALVALDKFGLTDILTVKEASSEGSFIGLKAGEKLTFENLLYAMLLPSANDAAETIAQNYPGGESAFVEKMNETARIFLLYNTHYADPAGLLDNQNYTTAFDLARLVSYALKNKTFAEVVSTKDKIIANTEGDLYPIKNLNKLLGVYGVNGVKTGSTIEAGEVLVTSKVEEGHTLIIVVMKSQDRFEDTEKLLKQVSGNITYLPIHH